MGTAISFHVRQHPYKQGTCHHYFRERRGSIEPKSAGLARPPAAVSAPLGGAGRPPKRWPPPPPRGWLRRKRFKAGSVMVPRARTGKRTLFERLRVQQLAAVAGIADNPSRGLGPIPKGDGPKGGPRPPFFFEERPQSA